MKDEMLNENGIPQTDVDEIDQIEDVTSNDKEEVVDVPQFEEASSESEESSETKETVLDNLSPEDGFFPRAQRVKSPFSVRMKVTNQFIVVTVKRVENDDTQVFYIPVRW